MPPEPSRQKLPLTAIAALGVVFGDIGTSPLYAFKECMNEGSTSGDVLGVVSLILWSLIILISLKYVALVLRADNQGEGGILALLNLAFPENRSETSLRTVVIMTSLGLLGAALLYGDGVITPAISVLSSVEGLVVYSPRLNVLTVPLTVIILLALFAIQKRGSGAVGKVFGGVMLVWFGCLALIGLVRVAQNPSVLFAINPLVGLEYLVAHRSTAVLVLGSVFLAVTGGEALYADLGHFGRAPIKLAWNFLVLPALTLNYLGQGAIVLSRPESARNPFFLLFPDWALLPMVILATAATVIASQALISGIFSLTMQACQMGYLPRLRVLHTSAAVSGQVYIPPVNLALAAACVGLVIGFGSSSRLASAYGVAVTLTMLTTTCLFFFACRRIWQWPLWRASVTCGLFASIELAFFGSNALKILHGGWLPLAIGGALFYLMTTWKMGRQVINRQMEMAVPLADFVAKLQEKSGHGELLPLRSKGTAVFLTASTCVTPGALVQNVKHNRVLHERNIVLTIVTDNVPKRDSADRLEIVSLPLDFLQVTAHYGFMEFPTIDEMLHCAAGHDLRIEVEETSFILGGQILTQAKTRGLPAWRETAFVLMSKNAQRASEFLMMPCHRTIEILWQAEI